MNLKTLPKSVQKIQPGCAIVFYVDDAEVLKIKRRISNEIAKLRHSRNIFSPKIQWEKTDNVLLANHIVARRINVGCADAYGIIMSDCDNLKPFLERYFDLADLTDDEILWIEANTILTYAKQEEHYDYLRENQARYLNYEELDIERIENETRVLLEDISKLIREYVSKTHQMPPMAEIESVIYGNLSLEKERLSDLTITNDLHITLPLYNNLEIPLQPLSKALYFLFLCHPEGIRLAEIDNYKNELEDLYTIIIPNRDENLGRHSIEILTDPLNSDSLRQQISRIKRIVKAKILNPAISEQYYITGERGEKYNILLSRNLVHLPWIISSMRQAHTI